MQSEAVTADDAVLRSSFGAAAAAYAEHRPSYAPDAVRWALAPAPGRRVLDLGAGTGKLTAVIAALGLDVTAVEPDPEMLAELRRGLPDVRALSGSAEKIPLPDGSVEAVLVGHALHWFDMALAGPEIARVLAPGGVLAALWNVYDDRVPWVRDLERVAEPAAIGPRDTLRSWRAATARTYLPARGEPTFGSPEYAEIPHGQRWTTDTLAAMLGTRAGVLVMTETERSVTMDRIRAHLEATPETVHEFDLPMFTGVLRVRPISGDQR